MQGGGGCDLLLVKPRTRNAAQTMHALALRPRTNTQQPSVRVTRQAAAEDFVRGQVLYCSCSLSM